MFAALPEGGGLCRELALKHLHLGIDVIQLLLVGRVGLYQPFHACFFPLQGSYLLLNGRGLRADIGLLGSNSFRVGEKGHLLEEELGAVYLSDDLSRLQLLPLDHVQFQQASISLRRYNDLGSFK